MKILWTVLFVISVLYAPAQTVADTAKLKTDTVPGATLHFYRAFIRWADAPIKKVPIYINDSLVYSLKANRMISFKIIKEGKYRIAVDKKGESEITANIKLNHEYYFRCTVEKGLWFGVPTIEAVKPAEGKAEIGEVSAVQ